LGPKPAASGPAKAVEEAAGILFRVSSPPEQVTKPEAVRPWDLGSPLTERVLGGLGRPRLLWILLWASSAVLAPLVLLALLNVRGESSRVSSVPNLVLSQVALSYVVALCLWGVGRLARGARAVEPQLARLTKAERPIYAPSDVTTVAGPLGLTLAISGVNTAGSIGRYGPSAIAIVPLLALSLLPIMTFVWTYLQLLVGIDRLGRVPLALDLFPQDRSLGLSSVGSLAFTGFVILFAAAIPILVTSSYNVSTVAVSLLVVAISVAMFFLSMGRLHHQMAGAKTAYVAQTRALFAEAYAPLRAKPTVKELKTQASALSVAQALEERAERILEWPVDERMTAWVAIIATGVVTSVIVRLLLTVAGL
jgi:hypothetical protein